MKKYGLIKALALLIAITIPCSACSGKQQPVQKFDRDGMLGVTNSNPNLPTSPNFHTYPKDYNMVRKALKPIRGIQKRTIVIHGGNLIVYIRPISNLSQYKRNEIRTEALQSVSQMMPRYHVSVKLTK